MPRIPYPAIPAYPGVPAIPREPGVDSGPPNLTIDSGPTQGVLASAAESDAQWGIYDSAGVSIWEPGPDAVLSTHSLDYAKETRISDFPIEAGSFANYNKVETPGNPVVMLVIQGTEADRTAFLSAVDDACTSTDLFSVVTPEFTYINHSVERYTYTRRSERGATMLAVEISLKEIRQVSAIYSTVSTPINQPQAVDATPQTNTGIVQPQPQSSTLRNALITNFPSLAAYWGVN